LISSAIIVSKKRRKDIIQIGSQIIARGKKGEKFEFTIVGSEDSNPIEGKISNESPLGQAFVGRKQEEEIQVETPKGKIKYKIVKIK
jgi:transcription elongation factor GreA